MGGGRNLRCFEVREKLRMNAMLSSSRQSMSCPTPIGHLLTQRLKIFAANVVERCLNVENRIWIEHVESFNRMIFFLIIRANIAFFCFYIKKLELSCYDIL